MLGREIDRRNPIMKILEPRQSSDHAAMIAASPLNRTTRPDATGRRARTRRCASHRSVPESVRFIPHTATLPATTADQEPPKRRETAQGTFSSGLHASVRLRTCRRERRPRNRQREQERERRLGVDSVRGPSSGVGGRGSATRPEACDRFRDTPAIGRDTSTLTASDVRSRTVVSRSSQPRTRLGTRDRFEPQRDSHRGPLVCCRARGDRHHG
jgi:hypothetical protein